MSLGPIVYPSGKDFQLADGADSFKVYEDEALVTAPLALAAGVEDGPVEFSLEVTFQACDDQRCLAPHKVKLDLKLEASAGTEKGELRHKAIFENLGLK